MAHDSRMRSDLTTARKAKGLTQGQLANLVGIDQGAISKIEKGDRSISTTLAPRLAHALGLDVLAVLYSPEDLAQAVPDKQAA